MNRLLAIVATFAGLAGLSPFVAAAEPKAAPPPAPTLRLPDGARPTRYALALTVVPGEARVAGEIAIDVELARPHAVLWLNAEAVEVTRATTALAGTRTALMTGNDQVVGVGFDPPLPAGSHRVTLSFTAGQSTNSTRGIFALQDGGAWYAMTQFEAISARRAFPCFDEPGFKTPWQVTLRVPRDAVALSNSRIESESVDADGLKTVRFHETRPLPTYLVAFAVGPWEFVDLGRVGSRSTPTRIVVPRGRTADTAFVSATYPELFNRLESWFGMPYPYDKLDHIAIPLTVRFAMENTGLITYGAPNILARPNATTPRFRRGAANIGAHEIAHHWFGNLVTTQWWDDIWLNEAFATWIAEKTVSAWRPDYDHGAARIEQRAEAIDADVLTSARKIREPIASRGDIFNAFDSITYQKGATVIGMVEGWIGEEPFRQGVRRYLEARPDGSATAADFLAALTQASGQPVAPAFDTFLNQKGVPQVDVRLQCAAGRAKLALTQRRLVPLGAPAATPQRWQIPVCARYGTGTSSRQACTLMVDASATLELAGGCPAFVVANAGGRGYYVPDYRDDLLERLAKHRRALSTPEYASLLYDLQALVRAGTASPAQALSWIRLGAAERDRHVVLAAVELAAFVGDTLVPEADRSAYSAFVRRHFGGRARSLGFASRPKDTDDEALLRRALLRLAAPEDPALAQEARRLALAWIRDRSAVDPGLVDVVLVTAGRTGDAALFDALLAEAKTTRDRLDQRNLLMALFAFTDPALAPKGMAVLLDPAFDVRESWTAFRSVYGWNPTRRAPNDFIVANFDALAKAVSREAPGQWPSYASGLCTAADEAALVAFWKDRAATYASAGRQLASAVEAIQLCTRLRASAGRIAFGR